MIGKFIYYAASIILNRCLVLLPLKEKRVLFLSDVREDLSGNFKFIYDKIVPDYDIKLSLKADRRIKRTFIEWIKQCYFLATSQYILLDDYSTATAYIHVRRGQELVQLWHSSGAYKKFAHSRTGENGDIKHIHAGYKRYTKTITSSEFVRPCFSEAFSIPEERVLATGIPRTDVFFDEKYKEAQASKIRETLPIIRDRKVVLFAPTYRGVKVEDADYDFGQFDLDKFVEELRNEYVLLIKWHPALFNNLKFGKVKGYNLEKYKDDVIDISESREINNYLFITDILITDYSSVIFDYALLNRPIIYFAYDLEKYRKGRGLYFPFDEYVYGSVASDTESLIRAVKQENMENEKRRDFIQKFVEKNDGHATDRVIEEVFSDIDSGRKLSVTNL